MSDVPVQPGAPLPTTDIASAVGNDVINDLVSVEIPLVEKAAETAEPFMAWPVIKQVWEGFFSYFATQLGQGMATLTGYVIVDVQKYLALKNAASALAQLQSAQASGDTNAISQASAAADAAVAPILHYIGSSGQS